MGDKELQEIVATKDSYFIYIQACEIGNKGVQLNSLYKLDNARFLFEKCAEMNNANCYFNLAIIYYQAIGVEKNITLVSKHLTRAMELGHKEAESIIIRLQAKGEWDYHWNEKENKNE